MKAHTSRTVLFVHAAAMAGAMALALSGAPVLAQSGQASPNGATAGPTKPAGDVSGVVVQAPRRRAKFPIPPDKKAAYDAEAAKSEAWKTYRKSTPPAAAGPLAESKDYPGLQELVPHGD